MDIARCIAYNYRNFDGFVVLHGTDTMAYTASLLSFVLENLGKTICFTGSQIPMSELRNDAADNLLAALLIAGTYNIPEVVLYFHDKLLRGNRASKVSSNQMGAFDSVNCDPLGSFNVTLAVRWSMVLPRGCGHIELSSRLEENISYLVFSPCVNTKTLELCLLNSKAVVLAGYGMGNLPTSNPTVMAILEAAIKKGVIICIMTQCARGGVNDVYETGRMLTNIGCVLTADMTIECIIAKLMYLLGKVSCFFC